MAGKKKVDKKNFGLLYVLIIIVAVGFVSIITPYFHGFDKNVAGQAISLTTACSETDAGDDVFTLGTTMTNRLRKTDLCQTEDILVEYYCEKGDIKSKTYDCICYYGECAKTNDIAPLEIRLEISNELTAREQETMAARTPIPKDLEIRDQLPRQSCTDSDGGMILSRSGTVTFEGEEYNDQCCVTKDNCGDYGEVNYIKEYYCNEDDESDYIIRECSGLCYYGACS